MRLCGSAPQQVGQRAQRQTVRLGAETRDRPVADAGRDAMRSEWLPGMNVRDVDLDGRLSDRGDRVAQRVGVMGESGRIDHDPVDGRGGAVQLVDDRPLGIVLDRTDVDLERFSDAPDPRVDIRECRGSVHVGLASPQQVEIRPVDDQHVHWGGVRGGKALALEKCEPVPDRIISATAADGSFSVVAGVTTSLVRETQSRHELSPTASAALGRLVTGATLLGASLKGKERLSLQVASDGPLRGMAADVSLLPGKSVGARGYARAPQADLPLNARGKFDVAGLVGRGHLQVTRSFEVGQPYMGIVPLRSGEIGDDIACYLADSEQIPSIVALGVLANREGIKVAGGAIAQLMPGAADRTIEALERRAATMPTITAQVDAGATPEDLARSIAGDVELRSLREYEVVFACRCTRERVETALLALGRDELLKIAREQPRAEAICEFCKKRYVLSREEVGELVARLPRRSQSSP